MCYLVVLKNTHPASLRPMRGAESTGPGLLAPHEGRGERGLHEGEAGDAFKVNPKHLSGLLLIQLSLLDPEASLRVSPRTVECSKLTVAVKCFASPSMCIGTSTSLCIGTRSNHKIINTDVNIKRHPNTDRRLLLQCLHTHFCNT